MDEKDKNKEGEKKEKITLAEIILVGLLLATVDIFQFISLIALPVPVVGQVMALFSTAAGVCATLLVQFYLTMKKIGNLWFLASGLVPGRTLTWLLVAFFANNPRIKKITDKVGGGALPLKV